jgi:hypothetical protein
MTHWQAPRLFLVRVSEYPTLLPTRLRYVTVGSLAQAHDAEHMPVGNKHFDNQRTELKRRVVVGEARLARSPRRTASHLYIT